MKQFLIYIILLTGVYKTIWSYDKGHIDRPISAPFISGDDFRAICKFVVDENFPIGEPDEYRWNHRYFDPQDVCDGDLIFVNLAFLEGFFKQYHPKIKTHYILVSHNHDFPAPGPYRKFLDDEQLFAWFTQNCDYNHSKIIPIPIGLSNKHWKHSRNHTEFIGNLQTQKDISKKYLLYVNFTTNTAPHIRIPVYHYFSRLSFSTCTSRLTYEQNYNNILRSKFVVSPHGHGLDCHRTWEALYLGSFPIVKTSTLDPMYDELPVVIVNDWTEVTEKLLEQKYQEFTCTKWNFDKLCVNYWLDLIKQTQLQAKNHKRLT